MTAILETMHIIMHYTLTTYSSEQLFFEKTSTKNI